MSDDAMKALADRLEEHVLLMANTGTDLSMKNWNTVSNDILLAARTLRAALAPQADECRCPEHGSWVSKDDQDRLVRELDVLLNGEDGAAKQASLCDIVSQVRREQLSLYRGPHPAPPADDEIEAIRARHEARKSAPDTDAFVQEMVQACADFNTLLRALDAERAWRVEVEDNARLLVRDEHGFLVPRKETP